MGYRSNIVYWANFWAAPGMWKPAATDLVDFFAGAGAEQSPSVREAQEALNRGGTGVKIGTQMKQWCGVFACCVVREGGVRQAHWTLYGGKILGIDLVWSHGGMQPGDVAILPGKNQHHIIVTDVDYDTNTMKTVEGNTMGQLIKTNSRRATDPYAYYRIPE